MSQQFGGGGAATRVKNEYDRGVHIMEDGTSAALWWATGTGTGYGVSQATNPVYSGTTSVKVNTRSSGAAQGDFCQAGKDLGFPYGSTLYYRGRLYIYFVSSLASFDVRLDLYDGTRHYRATLRYDPVNKVLQYLNSSGTYTDISGYGWTLTNQHWISFELQVDVTSHEYVAAFFGGTRTALTDLAIYDVEASTDRRMEASFVIISTGAAQVVIYLDNIYLGEHEDV